MRTVLEVLKLSTDFLKQKGIHSPRRQAEELISDALGIPRLQLYVEFDRPMVESELDICRKRLQRRSQGEPAQYIHGQVEFKECSIKVNPNVLIPRQETEILVDKIIRELAKTDCSGKVLWDICTGSGCIGIALKKHLPELKVCLADISPEALKLAQENAEANGVDVEILEGDLLAPFVGSKADLIVCNPPYISKNAYVELDPEVRLYEPPVALIGGETGLEFYQRLAEELASYLNPSGKAWFEIGFDQGMQLKELFKGPPWKHISVEKDWGGHDRFFFLEIE